MAQATSLSTTSTARFHNHADSALAGTRRSFIHSIAALSIAAATPAATAQAIDADLIELGAQFEPLVDQFYVARKRWARSDVPAYAEYKTMVADHAECQGSFERHQAMDDCWERWSVEEPLVALLAIKERMEELTNAINAAPVSSIAGLRVKALAAFWQIAPEHSDDIEYSFDDRCSFQQLFTAVAELCGLNDKVAAVGYQLPDVAMADDDDIGGVEIVASPPVSITIR
jgi:hypothetical protein